MADETEQLGDYEFHSSGLELEGKTGEWSIRCKDVVKHLGGNLPITM